MVAGNNSRIAAAEPGTTSAAAAEPSTVVAAAVVDTVVAEPPPLVVESWNLLVAYCSNPRWMLREEAERDKVRILCSGSAMPQRIQFAPVAFLATFGDL